MLAAAALAQMPRGIAVGEIAPLPTKPQPRARLTADQIHWNKEVAAKKAAKMQRKAQRQ